jgi:hypothetical protein
VKLNRQYGYQIHENGVTVILDWKRMSNLDNG